jgi:hypothetical protein
MPPLLTLLFSQKKSNKNSRMFRSFFFFGFGFCFTIFRVEKGWSSCSIDNRLDGSMNAGKKKNSYISWHIWKERKRRGVCVCLLHYRILTTLSTRPINFHPFGWGWLIPLLLLMLHLVQLRRGGKIRNGKGKRSKTMAGKISPDSHA